MNATHDKQQAHDAAEASASWNEYMREQAYRAERFAPMHERVELPAPSFWQLIREEFRENEAAFIGGALIWLVLLGIGCVLVAVRQGWLS